MTAYRKIMFVNPGTDPRYGYGEPMNLAMLATFIQAQGYAVRLVDELVGQDVATALDEFQPDLVGVTGVTPLANDAYRVARLARERGIATVMGGVHASVLTAEVLEHFDMVVIGEGEYALLDILQQGLGQGVVSSGRLLNLDDPPPIDRNLLPMEIYLGQRQKYPHNINYCFVPPQEPILNMIVSRGCNARCTFCHNSWRGKGIRYRSGTLVAEEIAAIQDRYGVHYFNFMDDNLFANRRKAKELFQAFIDHKLNIQWGCYSRVDCVSREMLELAQAAGCQRINFGFESGSQKIMDSVKKHLRVDKIEPAVQLCNDLGIVVVGSFILGHAEETAEDIALTRQLLRRLKLDYVGITLLTPFPGTELWEWCKEHDRIPETIDWSVFDYNHIPVRISNHFSNEALLRIRQRMLIEAYLFNRKILLDFIKSVFMSPMDIFRRVREVLWP